MNVSDARFAGETGDGPQVHLVPDPSVGPRTLVHHAHLVAGVHVSVDLMSPGRWHALSFPAVNDMCGPLLQDLIGDRAADRVRVGRGGRPLSAGGGITVDPARAAPWLRVAFVDALDRWLQAPLEQALVDAERGVSRGFAARTLPQGPTRALLIGDALRLARRASHGFGAFLRGLARHSHPIPYGLAQACRRLVDGYAELSDEVRGPDRELSTVLRAWRRLSVRLEEAGRRSPGVPYPTAAPRPSGAPHTRAQPTGMIDPRQVSARIFALSGDPAAAEVVMHASGPESVLVRVPAFARAADPDIRSRLLVRLVDRRCAAALGHALLGRVHDQPFYEATVPLCGRNVSDVRADVFDALSDVQPASTDTDRGLREARSAVVFLGEWRRMAASAQSAATVAAPARALRALAARLQPRTGRPGDALFAGGPSAEDLEELTELSEVELLSRLRGDGSPADDMPPVTCGSAGLLVAEIAAAAERTNGTPGH